MGRLKDLQEAILSYRTEERTGETLKKSFLRKKVRKKSSIRYLLMYFEKEFFLKKEFQLDGLGLKYLTPAVEKESNSGKRKSCLEKRSSCISWLNKSKAMAI